MPVNIFWELIICVILTKFVTGNPAPKSGLFCDSFVKYTEKLRNPVDTSNPLISNGSSREMSGTTAEEEALHSCYTLMSQNNNEEKTVNVLLCEEIYNLGARKCQENEGLLLRKMQFSSGVSDPCSDYEKALSSVPDQEFEFVRNPSSNELVQSVVLTYMKRSSRGPYSTLSDCAQFCTSPDAENACLLAVELYLTRPSLIKVTNTNGLEDVEAPQQKLVDLTNSHLNSGDRQIQGITESTDKGLNVEAQPNSKPLKDINPNNPPLESKTLDGNHLMENFVENTNLADSSSNKVTTAVNNKTVNVPKTLPPAKKVAEKTPLASTTSKPGNIHQEDKSTLKLGITELSEPTASTTVTKNTNNLVSTSPSVVTQPVPKQNITMQNSTNSSKTDSGSAKQTVTQKVQGIDKPSSIQNPQNSKIEPNTPLPEDSKMKQPEQPVDEETLSKPVSAKPKSVDNNDGKKPNQETPPPKNKNAVTTTIATTVAQPVTNDKDMGGLPPPINEDDEAEEPEKNPAENDMVNKEEPEVGGPSMDVDHKEVEENPGKLPAEMVVVASGQGQEIVFPEQQDSHFFAYFLTVIIIIILGYLVVHNKQKILGLIVEGRGGQRRRSHSYRKLDTEGSKGSGMIF